MTALCGADSMHPYNCFGPGRCIHCDRISTSEHRVGKCAFCLDDLQFIRAGQRAERNRARLMGAAEAK